MKLLLELMQQADDFDISDGKKAYIRYHDVLMELAHVHGFEFERVVGAFCALSPNNDYFGNLRSVVSIMHYLDKDVPHGCIPVSTYGHCKDRAILYLQGVPFMEHAKGLKIKSFFQNIMDPTDDGPVTVDGHMYRAWSGTPGGMKGVAMNKTTYRKIADDIRAVAKEFGMLPNQAQAVLWYTRKRLLRIVYSNQFDLLGHGGFQRAAFKPQELQPYPIKDK